LAFSQVVAQKTGRQHKFADFCILRISSELAVIFHERMDMPVRSTALDALYDGPTAEEVCDTWMLV